METAEDWPAMVAIMYRFCPKPAAEVHAMDVDEETEHRPANVQNNELSDKHTR